MRKERQRSAASAASTLSHLSLASLETRGPFPDSHHLATRVWRADAYLYCVEVRCPETGWLVPLAPSWVIGEKTNTIATLVPLREEKRYRIDIKSAASPAEMKAAKLGTIRKGRIIHPVLEELGLDPASIDSVRTAGHGKDPSLHHANGLRLWENDDLVPRPDDVFQERLYCVRWIETRIDKKSGNPRTTKHYRSITKHDLAREQLALDLLRERFGDWQEKGFIPSMKIEAGVETERLQRERGWTQWHHLFNPRHLLIHGLVTKIADSDQAADLPMPVRIANLLWIGSLANKDSKLSVWNVSSGVETSVQVFSNLSLNTSYYSGSLPCREAT